MFGFELDTHREERETLAGEAFQGETLAVKT